MTAPRLLIALAAGCVYFASIGFLMGVLVERVRFDGERTAVINRLSTTEQRVRGHLMDLERLTERRAALPSR